MIGVFICSNARGKDTPDFTSLVYVKPYCRISPYLVGMALGYVLHLQKDSTKKPKWVRNHKDQVRIRLLSLLHKQDKMIGEWYKYFDHQKSTTIKVFHVHFILFAFYFY